MEKCPNYLRDYSGLWKTDPHAANLEWWKNAKFGMFLHYGLYSMLGDNEWVQFRNKIPVAKYANLKNSFTAHNFDADYITELALESEMKYINLTTCHHDGFCLWDSKTESFNSVNSPCGRDLVRELAEMCDKKGLGFFTYYTFIQNWKHPHSPSRDIYASAKPDYAQPQSEYLFSGKEDFRIFVDYIKSCTNELLHDVGITAGIWYDLIMGYYPLRDKLGFEINEIYDMIRAERPDILLSFKQGVTGTEDFATPEQHFHSLEEKIRVTCGKQAALEHKNIWETNLGKHNEICATMQVGSWAFNPFNQHRNANYCYELLGHANMHNANLLLNVGPLGDGSISPIQASTLKELGKRIRAEGYPETGNIVAAEGEYIAG